MRLSVRASIVALSLIVPMGVFAQNGVSLPPVKGLSATFDGSAVTVTWKAPQGIDIAYYRVYHSTTSILKNNGLYDDFEVTKGPETTLVITPPPGGGQLFAAVIAVAQNGQESPYFVEETSTSTSAVSSSTPPPAPQSSEAPPPPPAPQSSSSVAKMPEEPTVRLLKANVPSPEEIDVMFSSPVTVDPAHAPEGLRITAPDGSKLAITKLTINESTMKIYTEKQIHGLVYNVQFSEPFKGLSGKPLDAADRSVLVTGHKDGKDAPQGPVIRQSNPAAPPDVTDVKLTPALEGNGAYALTAEWKVDNSPKDLVYVIVYQTRDARTFGPPSALPVDIRGVQLRNVTPGFFGMYIRTVNIYGAVSPGVFHYVSLPPYGPTGLMQGQLMFGEISAKDLANAKPDTQAKDFSVVDPATQSGGLAQVAAMEVPTVHAAAPEMSGSHALMPLKQINWMHAAILAGMAAGSVIFVVIAVVICQKRNCSAEA